MSDTPTPATKERKATRTKPDSAEVVRALQRTFAGSRSASGERSANGSGTTGLLLQRCSKCASATTEQELCPACRAKQQAGETLDDEPEGPIAGERDGGSGLIQMSLLRMQRQWLQRDLTVNAPGDRYEQEAERVADAVMRSSSADPLGMLGSASASETGVRGISRIVAGGEAPSTVSSDVETRVRRMQDSGQTLPEAEQSFFETHMGYDFSGVRVHTDTNAVQTSRDLSARAFTFGNHIAFNDGAYQPGTDAGRHLLAHELTHVVQQSGAGVARKASVQRSAVLSHLQRLGGGQVDAGIYRKEIAAFQREHRSADLHTLQRALLDPSAAEVGERDHSRTLRRKGGGTAPAPTTTTTATPTLRFTSVSAATPSNCGGFSWPARWSIDNATSSTNGWIVQKVELLHDVKDCSDRAVDIAARGALNPAWYPLWEAWQVRGGRVFVGGSTSPHNADTYGSPAVGDSTKGFITVRGTAEYYDGLTTLPSGFTVRNAAPAWALPVTNSQPTLTGGTGSIDHSLTARWDCCTTTKTTTITTS